MSCYMAKRAKKTTRVVGLMSSTSADGVDAAVVDVTGLSRRRARSLFGCAEGRLKAAIVMHFRGVHLPEALEILKENSELLRPAIVESEESA